MTAFDKDHNISASLHAVYHFKIAQAVPLEGSISFASLSSAVGIDEMNLARIIRLLITERIFTELAPGFVAHSAASRLLATDSGMQATVGHMLEGASSSSARMVEALEKFKGSQEPPASAWTLNFGAPFFGYMSQHPQILDRFAACMGAWSGNVDFVAHMVDSFDWSALGDGLVVDVSVHSEKKPVSAKLTCRASLGWWKPRTTLICSSREVYEFAGSRRGSTP